MALPAMAAAPWQWTGAERVLDEHAGAMEALRLDDVAALASVVALKGAEMFLLPTSCKAYALHFAVEHASINVLSYLVDGKFSEIDALDGELWTALFYASVYHPDDVQLAHALLCRGADFHKRNSNGETPETAADDGDAASVAELLQSVARAGSYDAWAAKHVDHPLYGPLIAASRPGIVRNERRLQLALLKHQVDRVDLAPRAAPCFDAPADAACRAALAFAFGTDGGKGHNVFATIAKFVV
jgi:hypothetical protein